MTREEMWDRIARAAENVGEQKKHRPPAIQQIGTSTVVSSEPQPDVRSPRPNNNILDESCRKNRLSPREIRIRVVMCYMGEEQVLSEREYVAVMEDGIYRITTPDSDYSCPLEPHQVVVIAP